MTTKTTVQRRVRRKQISYKQLAEMLMQLNVEFILMGDAQPENEKNVTATHFVTDDTIMFQFEDSDFILSLDLVRKGGRL